MRDYEIDLFGLDPLIRYGTDYLFCGCSQTYKNTNERLADIYSKIDFNNKNVFSVLSSSDQVFSAYFLGATNVDTFDSNWTTYYYFYLKKWNLMFYCNYILETKSNDLLDSLAMYDVNCWEERKVYEVWKKLLLKYDDISKLFYGNDLYEWNVPYNQDIKQLIDSIKDKQANFVELNIFRKFQMDKKYDIVILSNILEYIYPDDAVNLILSDNLRSILNDDGIIICSVLNDRYFDSLAKGRNAFNLHFTYEQTGMCGYNNYLKKEMPLYYVYRKKS